MTVADDFGALNDACKIATDKIGSIAYRHDDLSSPIRRLGGRAVADHRAAPAD